MQNYRTGTKELELRNYRQLGQENQNEREMALR